MRRSVGSVLVCALVAVGLWFAPGLGRADGIDTIDTSLTPADRGTSVQLESTAPPPTVYPSWSGDGKRVIYSKSMMHVWAVGDAGELVRDYPVSGRLDQPDPGTYFVYSKSMYTCNVYHPDICMRYMTRFATGPLGGNIGFHEIPEWHGTPLQTNDLLGTPQSDGCVRQSTADAQFMWDFAPVGTKVVVIP